LVWKPEGKRLAEGLLAPQEGLCSTVVVSSWGK